MQAGGSSGWRRRRWRLELWWRIVRLDWASKWCHMMSPELKIGVLRSLRWVSSHRKTALRFLSRFGSTLISVLISADYFSWDLPNYITTMRRHEMYFCDKFGVNNRESARCKINSFAVTDHWMMGTARLTLRLASSLIDAVASILFVYHLISIGRSRSNLACVCT